MDVFVNVGYGVRLNEFVRGVFTPLSLLYSVQKGAIRTTADICSLRAVAPQARLCTTAAAVLSDVPVSMPAGEYVFCHFGVWCKLRRWLFRCPVNCK